MTESDTFPVVAAAPREAPGPVTACVLCRDPMTPKRARTVSSFLCGACEGVLVTHSAELVRWPTGFDAVLGVAAPGDGPW